MLECWDLLNGGPRRSQGAFGLAETIVAWGLLGTVLVLVLQLLPTCVMAYRTVQHEAQADALGSSLLGRQAAAFENLTIGPPQAMEPVPEGDVEFRPSVQVLEQPGCAPTHAKRLRVTVEWVFRNRACRWSQETCVRAPL